MQMGDGTAQSPKATRPGLKIPKGAQHPKAYCPEADGTVLLWGLHCGNCFPAFLLGTGAQNDCLKSFLCPKWFSGPGETA